MTSNPSRSFLILLVCSALFLTSCTSLPEKTIQLESFKLEPNRLPGQDSTIKQNFQPSVEAHKPDSGFYLLAEGLEAYAARASLIALAEHTIDVQYYFIRYDLAGTAFMNMLLDAADRGVRVRVLLDDYYLGDKDELLLAIDGHPNLEIRTFNPFSRSSPRVLQYATKFGQLSRRMHNKSFIVDGQVAIVGGRNIGDEYFDASSEIEFGDLDVVSIGPIVSEVSQSFEDYWSHLLSYNVSVLLQKIPTEENIQRVREEIRKALDKDALGYYADSVKNSQFVKSLSENRLQWDWSKSSLVVDSPDKLNSARGQKDLALISQIEPLFKQAEQELVIFSPYFVPAKEGTKGLISLSENGVNVRVLTNSATSNNVSAVHAHYSKYRKSLLAGGVELYEIKQTPAPDTYYESDTLFKGIRSSTLHAKSMLFDRKIVYIGSFNFDPRSAVENTEMGVVIESDEMATEMANWFDENLLNIAYKLELSDSRDIVWQDSNDNQQFTRLNEPNLSRWGKLKLKLMSWLPIESLM